MRRALAVLAVVVTVVFVIAGCGGNAQDAPRSTAETGAKLNGDFSGAGEVPGALVSANSLSVLDIRLKPNTSIAARVTYTSTSGIDDSHTQVTGTVFVPIGTPPKDGWPVVAFAHADTGSLNNCGPSLSPDLANSSESVTALVLAGYAVTMPDYQGLGDDQGLEDDSDYHPYLDSTTAGYNLIDSVRAARRLSPDVSTKWLAIGTGQGGQAAWAANELVENYGGDLDLIGVAALSPIADINGFADAAAAGTLTTEQKLTFVGYLNALDNEYDLVELDDFRRGTAEEDWDLLLSCNASDAAARSQAAERIAPDDLRPISPDSADTLKGFLQKTTLPLGPTKAPMLVIYGGRDPLIPAPWTAGALAAACKMDDVIDIQFRPDEGQIDPSAAFSWLTGRFAGDAPVNSCDAASPSADVAPAVAQADPTEDPTAQPEAPAEVPEETFETAPATTAPPATALPATVPPTTDPPTAAPPATDPPIVAALPTVAAGSPLPGPPVDPVVGPPPGPAP